MRGFYQGKTGKEKTTADPCGMTNENQTTADPCGMTNENQTTADPCGMTNKKTGNDMQPTGVNTRRPTHWAVLRSAGEPVLRRRDPAVAL
jgi:hypothetical protein